MRIIRTATLAAIVALTITTTAHAAPHQFKFLSGSGVSGWGTQVGTYKGQLDGAGVDIFCVDFLNHISAGNNFQVNLTDLGGSSLANTRWGFYNDALVRYRQAAWLAWQFYNPAYQQDWKYIHAAIWHLMTPTQPSVTLPSDIARVNGWLTNASNNYAQYDFSHVLVVTDVALARCHAASPELSGPFNGCGHQEQITFTAPLTVTTPEPAQMVLLATGLIALTITSRRRRKR